MQMASKSLMDTLSEIYEQEWVGHEQIPIKAQALDLLWDDYFRKMNDVLNPINNYITKFHDMRNKIGKRGRKLVDYDKSRHNVEALRNSAKKKDDVKLTKAREELEQAKNLYEQLNNELHDDLPRLYDSRIPFFVKNLQTFFDAECRFHGENAVIYQFLNETMHKLARDSGHPIGGPMAQAPQLSTLLASPVPQQHNSSNATVTTPPSHQNSKTASLRTSTGGQQQNSFAVTSSTSGEVRPYEEIDFKKDGPGSMSSTNDTLEPPPLPVKQRKVSGGNATSTVFCGCTIIAVLGARATVECGRFDREFGDRVRKLQIPDDLKRQVLKLVADVLRLCVISSCVASTQTDSEFWKLPRIEEEKPEEQCKDLVALDLATPVMARDLERLPGRVPMLMPTCIGCNLDTKMKCIWLSEREQEAFKHHPWMCLKCAVRNPIESIVPGMMDRNANMCIWFNQVTRLKAKYTEFKLLPNEVADELKDTAHREKKDLVHLPMLEEGRREDQDSLKGGPSTVSSTTKSPLGMNGQRTPQPDHGVYDIPVGATTTDLPAGTLYRVRATYKYTAEDVDELNFESGEVIRVIEYEDPEEQEEGWLMGVK
ncbi:myc box-dependent-interacting protein 1-like, partial [Tropilaelaps mercedesae]